ncbi:MAG TPA: hypothetical protein VFY78_00030, partial [Gammaproteobacteria bacterium]|nr:hypothetical protein [Gammaproteobacteria bacterium]
DAGKKTKARRNRCVFKLDFCHTFTLLPDFLSFAPLRLRVRSFLSRLVISQQAVRVVFLRNVIATLT